MDLVDIGAGHRLAPAPAAAYLRARAAGCPAGITSSYRDPAQQAAMRAAYLTAKARGEKVAYVAPVEKSEHVTGQALDLPPEPRAWFRAHPEYGFRFTDPTEAWHIAYRLALDTTIPATPTPTPPATSTPEETMKSLINVDKLGGNIPWYLIDWAAGTAQRIWNGIQLDIIAGLPDVRKVQGLQPRTVLDGLTIQGEDA